MEFTDILRQLVGLAPAIVIPMRPKPRIENVKITARVSTTISFQQAQDLGLAMAKCVPYPARPVGFPKRVATWWVFSLRVACPRAEARQVARWMGEQVPGAHESDVRVEKA